MLGMLPNPDIINLTHINSMSDIQMNSLRIFRSSISSFRLALVIILIICSCIAQAPTQVHIQSRKFSAISGEQANTRITRQRASYTVPYSISFNRKPDVGLSVYNMQFDYNPEFSINVVQQNSNTSHLQFYVVGRPSDSNILNELFIMYIASDYDQVGIYMPGPKNTTAKIGIPSQSGQRFQDFTFNYKNAGNGSTVPLFTSSTNQNNIRVSVYLTGITAESQTTINGYSRNYAYFSLSVTSKTFQFYMIRVKVKSSNGDVLIKTIQFTIVYFDFTAVAPQYQMDSNLIVASNFGGTFFKSSYSAPLESLPEDSRYQNTLQYFFGISEIECSEGQTINLLAVERFNYNNNGKLQNLVLTFQTERNTYILRGQYSYIQYKPRTCNNSASCGLPCDTTTTAIYRISNLENRCAPCTYFCASCDNAFNCTSCPDTRRSDRNGICVCKSNTTFDKPPFKDCLSCFDFQYCWTCEREGVCLSCNQQINFTINNVLRICQCSAGTYDSIGPNSKQKTNLSSRADSICQPCPSKCIYCTSPTECSACQVPTYLALQPKQIAGKIQTCTPMCTSSQYLNGARECKTYEGDLGLFDSSGRLGFQWNYKNTNNQLVVDLLFSQGDMTYYFYQNGIGYKYVSVTSEQTKRNDQGSSSVYYDDGNGYINGYNGGGSTAFTSSVVNTKITREGGVFDESALQGKYYGLGQAPFYKQRYESLKPQAQHLDQFGIPFGKYQLSSTTISDSATYLDAIRNNMQFMINGQSLPYTIKGLSGNHFQLTIQPQKSYLTSNASIVFKNPALVRSGQTALQTPVVHKELDRLDRYSPSQLATATSLRDRTATIVQILWGICKYILFLGFGWAVMPLMLILQYIFGHNYITSQLPLNLEYFLNSFADFRNPSILFNPQRNEFDASVVNHQEIYKRVASYEQFDRGIDFMKNSFQFFFVPLLSFALQFLLIGINFVSTQVCKKQIPLISKYLQPRLLHHAAAYTLVQALPISFFFFGQLQDQRYHHVNSPNLIYPSFNAGISYAAFFASIIVPIILLVVIYNYFKNKARSGTFQFDKVKGHDYQLTSNDPAMLADPLWGGSPYNTMSYGFSAAMFFLPLLVGFVLSFFTKTYPWQLTGLLVGFLGLTSFAAASKQFTSKIPKYFFVGIGLLMIAYQLVHAGIGSNRALTTYDQWNTGYLGVGIIYALLLAGIIFSGYLIYKLLSNIYNNIIKPYGCLSEKQKMPNLKTAQDEQVNLRDNTLGRRDHRQNTQMKSKIGYFNPQYTEDRLLNNGAKQQILGDIHMPQKNPLYRQDFQFVSVKPDGGTMFKSVSSGQLYPFPFWSSQILRQNVPLSIDSKQNIFRKRDNQQVGTVREFQKQKTSQTESDLIMNTNRKPNTKGSIQLEGGLQKQSSKNLNDAFNMVVNNNNQKNGNFLIVDGQKVGFIKSEDDDDFYMVGVNGKPDKKITKQQLLNVFIQNQNMLAYNGDNYYLKKGVQQDEEQFFFMESPKTKATIRVTEQQIFNIIGTQNQSSRQNIMSTSLLPQSGKAISEQNQFLAMNLGTNQNIAFANQIGQYLINGGRYEKIGQDAANFYFKNAQTGQKISVKRQQGKINSGSIKENVDKYLRDSQGNLEYQGQKYRFTGVLNSKYSFANVVNNNLIYLSYDQLAQIYGFKKPSFQVIQNNQHIHKMPANATKLRVEKFDKESQCYIYEDPRNGEQYQMSVEWVDANYSVYLDENNNFWHKGETIGEEESQSMNSRVLLNNKNPGNFQNTANLNNAFSNNTITSTASLSHAIVPNQLYTIQFLSPDYNAGSSGNLPSQKDIVEVKENVMGANVMQVIETAQKIYPNCKAFIESARFPSQKFLLQ